MLKGTAEVRVPQSGDDLSQPQELSIHFHSDSVSGVPLAQLNLHHWPSALLGPVFHSLWTLKIVHENHLGSLLAGLFPSLTSRDSDSNLGWSQGIFHYRLKNWAPVVFASVQSFGEERFYPIRT